MDWSYSAKLAELSAFSISMDRLMKKKITDPFKINKISHNPTMISFI
jgi:hypothetical protein